MKPFSKAGKLNERADVWRYPVSPSTDDVDADVKDEDERANTVAAKDAYVMDERGNEEDTADQQSNVPPGPAVEEEEHLESPPDRRSMNTTSPIFLFDLGVHAALPPRRSTGLTGELVMSKVPKKEFHQFIWIIGS